MVRISAFFLIALIMFATANPLAHGQQLGLPDIFSGLGGGGLLGGGSGLSNGGLVGGIIGNLLGGVIGLLNALLGGTLAPGGNSVALPPTVPPVLNTTLAPLVQGLNINGRLCCTPTGNCNATGSPLPLSGALVTLNCPGNEFANGSLVVGPVRTNINGNFNVTVFNAVGSLRSIPSVIQCNITVNVDQLVCPLLSGVGGALGAIVTGLLVPVAVVVDTLGRLILILTLNLSVGA